jgi:anti-anti-sigma factor
MIEARRPAFAARIHRGRGQPGATINVVELAGELDAASCDLCFLRCTEAGPHAVVELAALRFMDASGFRALEHARLHLEQRGGSLVWRGAVGEPARFLDLVGEHDLVARAG